MRVDGCVKLTYFKTLQFALEVGSVGLAHAVRGSTGERTATGVCSIGCAVAGLVSASSFFKFYT